MQQLSNWVDTPEYFSNSITMDKKVDRSTITEVAEVTGFVSKQLPIKYKGVLLFEA